MIAHNPIHGSGQAELPHPALTSGNNAHAAQGIRMTSTGGRQPAVDRAPPPGPEHVGVLAAPRKGAVPEPADLEPKRMQRHAVGRHAVIADVSTYDRAQPPADFRDGVMHVPMRPQTYSVWGERGISRFPCEVLGYVHGVCDRAGSRCTSRYRCTGWGLPLSPTASASRSKCLTRLNTRPAPSPVNASTSPLQVTPHDSGSVWVATLLPYDFFIHYTSPV
jgi:hypothetical protein